MCIYISMLTFHVLTPFIIMHISRHCLQPVLRIRNAVLERAEARELLLLFLGERDWGASGRLGDLNDLLSKL
jgi:hypothetical protein